MRWRGECRPAMLERVCHFIVRHLLWSRIAPANSTISRCVMCNWKLTSKKIIFRDRVRPVWTGNSDWIVPWAPIGLGRVCGKDWRKRSTFSTSKRITVNASFTAWDYRRLWTNQPLFNSYTFIFSFWIFDESFLYPRYWFNSLIG